MRLLFLIGFPRSGTKLLMRLLESNDQIAGTSLEVNLAVDWPTQSKAERLSSLRRSTLVENMSMVRNDTNLVDGNFLDFLSKISGANKGAQFVLDKSPRYTMQISKLSKLYPEAYFIFLHRDPLEVASSFRSTWGKHPVRTAYQWQKVHRTINDSMEGLDDRRIHTVSYKRLVEQPALELKSISDFLGIYNTFKLDVNSGEQYGKRKGKGVKRQRHKLVLTKREIELIEGICGKEAFRLGYQGYDEGADLPRQSEISKFVLRILDEYNSVKFYSKEKGFFYGIKYYMKLKGLWI